MNDAIFWSLPWVVEGLKQKAVPIAAVVLMIVGAMILLLTFARRLRKKH